MPQTNQRHPDTASSRRSDDHGLQDPDQSQPNPLEDWLGTRFGLLLDRLL